MKEIMAKTNPEIADAALEPIQLLRSLTGTVIKLARREDHKTELGIHE